MSSAFIVTPICEAVRASLPLLTNLFSPSKNPCVVKTTPMKGAKRFRYDPYRAHVLSSTTSPSAEVAPSFSDFVAPTVTSQPSVDMGLYGSVPPQGPTFFQHPHAAVPPMMMFSYFPMHTAPIVTVGSVPSETSSCPSVPHSSLPTRVPSPCPLDDPLPALAPAAAPAPIEEVVSKAHYVVVTFKFDSYTYVAPFRVAVGDKVMVEGDRGVNLGTVTKVTTENPESRPVISKVVRKATAKDLQTHAMLREKEVTATQFSQTSVKELCMTNAMRIVDTEYQFDQNKLTIFYRADKLVDFRKLQRVLFKEFRCRLWLVNLTEMEGGLMKKR